MLGYSGRIKMAIQKEKNMWIPLVDYSNKYSVSLSTLRRRIKSKSIKFKLDGRKYFLLDEPLLKGSPGRRPMEEESLPTYFENEEVSPVSIILSDDAPSSVSPPQNAPGSPPGATLSSQETKASYQECLEEKDRVILDLKTQITDLKTLVSVLESEVERLKYF